jgi:hypothetical protein
MRRYRKGQTWRPPSAAESAAHADAAEAHRRIPQKPQDVTPLGQTILVKTPEYGIPARNGDTIYWAKCHRCIERSTAAEKEIVETDEEVIVYNTDESDVPGNAYILTGLTGCETRHAMPSTAGHSIIRFRTISVGAFRAQQSQECLSIVAEVLEISCGASDVAVGDEVTIWDPSACWFNLPIEILENTTGTAARMAVGANFAPSECEDFYGGYPEAEACYWVVQHLCCTEEVYP